MDIYYITVISVSFNQSSYIVNEELETIQLTLLLSNPSSTNIIVPIRTSENTAKSKTTNTYKFTTLLYELYNLIGGEDYFAGKYFAIFLAGMTVASVDISIIDDNIFEDIENFNVTIMGNIMPNGVSRGTIRSATITILDIGKLFSYVIVITWQE